MIKTCLLIGLYPTEACPIFSYELAAALINSGYSVTVLLPCGISNKGNWQSLIGQSLRVIWVSDAALSPAKGIISKIKKAIRVACEAIKIGLASGNMQHDVALYTFFHGLNLPLTCLLKIRHKILFLHDPIMHSGEGASRRKRLKKQANAMDGLIVLSKQFVDDAKNNYAVSPNNILYMPLCLFRKPDVCAPARYGQEGEINFLFFGRIEPYKGVDILMDAYEKLLNEESGGARLTIAGSGNFEPYYGKYITLNNTRLVNRYIEEDEIAQLFTMNNCVLITPYSDATQSGVLSLALAFGVPVISSDVGGLKEQLNDGRLGLFFSPGDTKALCALMRKCVACRSWLNEESRRMIEFAAELSWDESTKRLMKQVEVVFGSGDK